jgi:hypothetical protein
MRLIKKYLQFQLKNTAGRMADQQPGTCSSFFKTVHLQIFGKIKRILAGYH